MSVEVILGLTFALLSALAAYLKLWYNVQANKQERSAMEVELRRQIAVERERNDRAEARSDKMEARLQKCEDRWHELYSQGR